jgi:predicted lipoprotein with Yx(FWY)xxD motif
MHSKPFLSYSLSRTWPVALVAAAFMLLIAACGSTTSGSGSSSSPTASSQNTTPTSSSGGRYGYGGGGTTPAASSSSSMLKTATATVGGKSETVLSNAQGMTLYYRTSDAPPATVCSAGCASAWPPFIVSGSAAPTSVTTLSGKLTTITDANGKQVAYNGHPLYTFSGDKAPGQTTGNGIAGVWFVATPALKVQGAQQTTPPQQATPTSSGY